MEIDDKTIERIAELAKLEFDAESKEEIREDMNKILDFVNKLNELDTDNVEPLVYMTKETNVLREDDAKDTVKQDEALKNAPKKDSDYFKVPKVLDK
jgi:aspartyl-tRNA(Asn)/glutamyl-tRNA(Gln) amidotransferase subunit C